MKDSISYSELRENLKEHLDRVCAEHVPLRVTRRNGESLVILSEEDFNAMEDFSTQSRRKKLVTLSRALATKAKRSGITPAKIDAILKKKR